MKKASLVIVPLLLTIALSGCNNTSSSNSNSNNSSQVIKVKSLSEAINNTKYYCIKNIGEDSRYYKEIYTNNFYYNGFNGSGYIVPASDSNYVHQLITTNDLESDTLLQHMNVYGRTGYSNQFEAYTLNNLNYILKYYASSFEKFDDFTYKSTDSKLCRAVADFFESKMLRYSNNITITIGKNGRLNNLYIYENDYPLSESEYILLNREDIYFYNEWVQNGSKFDERIYDYKILADNSQKATSLYEDDCVSFDAIVTAIDDNGDVYVANADNDTGNIGICIKDVKEKKFKVSDKVRVNTTIKTKNNVVYGINGSIQFVSECKHIPEFSEESIADLYGGGNYAYNFFSRYSYFNGSLYTTYAYVSSMPEQLSTNGDTIIKAVFPNISNSKSLFYLDVVIPNYLSTDTKTKLLNEFKNAGRFGEDNSYEICLERVIVQNDNDSQNDIVLKIVPSTTIFRKLSVSEKIEQYTNIANFPLINKNTSVVSYKFGEGTDYNIEEQYAISSKNNMNGLFIGQLDISENQYKAYIINLSSIPLSKYDEVKDSYGFRHVIFKNDGMVFDVLYLSSNITGQQSQLSMWIYKSDDIIQMPNIAKAVSNKISWFNANDFLKLAGTYDADYTIYELDNYANTMYDEPLICVTLDLNRNVSEDYKRALVQELGYSQYKENNKIYTYISRGQTHYVFTKNNNQYVDIACYHTSDYTYYGHESFEYRLEVLIYRGDSPIKILNYTNLDSLISLYTNIDPSLGYNVTLPSDAKVEIWAKAHEDSVNTLLNYGFGYRNEAFIYTKNVEEAYNSLKDSISKANYIVSNEYTSSILYKKTISGQLYNIFIMKEPEKGYVRIMNDSGGLSFYK